MPDRTYLPWDRSRGFRRRDRLAAHWYPFCTTLGSAGLGLLILVTSALRALYPRRPDADGDGAIDPPWSVADWHKWLNPAPSLALLPQWQGGFLGAVLLLGGLLWVFATLTSFKYVEDFWKVLRAGLLLLILGWTAYTACAMHMRPEWVVPWWIGATTAAAYAGEFALSLHHQWRLKGFPRWAVRMSDFFAPLRDRHIQMFSGVMRVTERWSSRRSLFCDGHRGLSPEEETQWPKS